MNNVGYNPNIQPQQVNNGVTIPIDAQKAASSNGVNIIIYNPSVNPNGANFNNTINNGSGQPGQAYPSNYYTTKPAESYAKAIAAGGLKENEKTEDKKPEETKEKPKKDVVQLTDEYIKTLENYLRNPNPDIKLMGAKELMKRFREDESRKNDVALTNLLNLTLQSKYSNVKMIGMAIVSNGWASGDDLTRQLLAKIQQSSGSYGLDALDAAEAALKSAGKTVKIVDNNPDFSKEKKTEKKAEK